MARTKPATAQDIADYIVAFSREHGDPISNLKVQKLLYYAEGWHLALRDGSLFCDPIQAWPRGPVVYSVWKSYSDFKWRPITSQIKKPNIGSKKEDFIKELIGAYGDFSAYTLERMTHDEPPWKEARAGLEPLQPSKNTISRKTMKEYFTTLANSGEEK